MSQSLKSMATKVAFKVAKHTLLKDSPEKFKDLIEQSLNSSKTKELPFIHAQFNGSSRHNGLILPAFVTEEQLRFYDTFKPRPEDVFIVTYPESGSVWLGETIRQILKIADQPDPMIKPSYLFEGNSHEFLDPLPSPRYMVTYLPLSLTPYGSDNGAKYIYLARNPKDVAVSYFYFMRQVPLLGFDGTWEEFLEYFMKGDLPWGSYFDHVLDWWGCKDNENVLFLKYEDMKQDLPDQVKIIADFLGYQFSDEEAEVVAKKCTFQEAMKANPNQLMQKLGKLFKEGSDFRKGIVGDWKNHFSEEQLEAFDELYRSRMNGTGLEFEF